MSDPLSDDTLILAAKDGDLLSKNSWGYYVQSLALVPEELNFSKSYHGFTRFGLTSTVPLVI